MSRKESFAIPADDEKTMKDVSTKKEVIQDIDLSPIRKKRFRIDGDNAKILELDVSDLNIFDRLRKVYPKLDALAVEASNKFDFDEEGSVEDQLSKFADALADIDNQMREHLDYLFDAPVSAVCAPNGTMYDLFNGQFRYQHIVEVLAKLYENNFSSEVQKMQKNVKKHTSKYIK